ncbi:YraN family protein [Paracoccus sp. XHP0099]|uniref:UPF0102 protein KNW02_09880 n=2 Tax=Paracoccus marinaquae TaxID=2841926 RepID=A0ABS6AKI9_9RHOB|nr:YraN family protein [Paracoccus marinaquae]
MDGRSGNSSWSAAPGSRGDDRDRTPAARRARGRLANLSGAMAEDAVAQGLEAMGMSVVARRWRGVSGEIDLICRDGNCTVFVEVKQAASHVEAGQRLGRRQMDRICAAAAEYCAMQPPGPQDEMRFDVALVDALGRVEVLKNAFAEV